MADSDNVYRALVHALAREWIERADGTGLKGRARDRAALDFIIGAGAYGRALGPTFPNLGTLAWVVSVRGHSELARIAASSPQVEEEPKPLQSTRNTMKRNMLVSSFDAWMAAVDMIVQRKTGLSVYDLDDCCFTDWYEDDVPPSRAAFKAIRNAGGTID